MSPFRFVPPLAALVVMLVSSEAHATDLTIWGEARIDCPGDTEVVTGWFEIDLQWAAGTPTSPGTVGYFGDAATMSEDAATMAFGFDRLDLPATAPPVYADLPTDVSFTDDGGIRFSTEQMSPYGYFFGFDWLTPSSPPAALPLELPLDGSSWTGWISAEGRDGVCSIDFFWTYNLFVEVDYDDDGLITFYRGGVDDCDWYGACDPCPFDPLDLDTDADGTCDTEDACPLDATGDSDGDGVCDSDDACPADATNDTDGDGACDSADACPLDPADDSDLDGACDSADPCPLDADDDLDLDGICGDLDLCPADATNDADGDGICGADDVCPAGNDAADADGDTAPDACDACPDDPANDADADGACADADPCPLDADDDLDADGACADADPCPADPYDDGDADGMCGDVDPCPLDGENDADGDGICEVTDNCDAAANSDQLDADADGRGDACESDVDADGVIDDLDNCPLHPNPSQADSDGDLAGDACDADEDADGVPDDVDACLGTEVGPVGLDGCSLDDLCPCDGAWKNGGAYQACIARESADLRAEGVLTDATRSAAVSAAAKSTCGRR